MLNLENSVIIKQMSTYIKTSLLLISCIIIVLWICPGSLAYIFSLLLLFDTEPFNIAGFLNASIFYFYVLIFLLLVIIFLYLSLQDKNEMSDKKLFINRAYKIINFIFWSYFTFGILLFILEFFIKQHAELFIYIKTFYMFYFITLLFLQKLSQFLFKKTTF